MTVEIERFGKDHWSALAYVECCAVDNEGRSDNRRMRCDYTRHPGLFAAEYFPADRKYPTILKGGEELPDHDDWDCLDDLEAAGFIEQHGTGLNLVVRFTDLGYEVVHALREHKAQGNNFAEFSWSE